MKDAVLTYPYEEQLDDFMYAVCHVDTPISIALTDADGLCHVFVPYTYNITDSSTGSGERVIELPMRDEDNYFIQLPEKSLKWANGKGTWIYAISRIKEVRIISQETHSKLREFAKNLFEKVDPIYDGRDVLYAYGLHDDADKENELAERIWNEHNKIDFDLV